MPNSTTKLNKIFFISAIFLFAFLNTNTVSAAVLTPGNISTCGELALPGTYTLTGNVSGGSDTCFDISSNGVTIDGADFSITGSSSSTPAIDARARTAGPGSPLTDGGNAYTNLLITALSISGYETGLNISGNDSTSGFAGDAGATEIFYSNIGDIVADGGTAGAETYGGTGGSISITDINLNISNTTFSTLAGSGTVGFNTDGGVVLNYTEAITTMGSLFSKMNFFNENDTSYGIYPGGTFPIQPGNIDSCGTLYGPGNFTLTGNATSTSGTCFWIATDDVVIDGGDYSIELLDASSTSYAIDAEYGDYDNLTINNLNFSNYQNIINSTQSVIINSDSDIDLSDGTIKALIDLTINAFANLNIASSTIDTDSLNINSRGTFSYASTTASALSSLIVNGEDYGDNFTGGDLSEFAKNAGDIWAPSTDSDVDTNRIWSSITSSSDGTKLAAVVFNGLIYTSDDSGATWAPSTDSDVETNRYWRSITSSSDGTKLAAVVWSGLIYTSKILPIALDIKIINPAASTTISSWQPNISWQSATKCEYSWNDFASTTPVNCALSGSDIGRPLSDGEHNLYVKGYGFGDVQTSLSTFTFNEIDIDIIVPETSAGYTQSNWDLDINYDPSGTKTLTSCYYSYVNDNFSSSTSTLEVDCTNNGSDIIPPTTNQGENTLYIKVVDDVNNIYLDSVTFGYGFAWAPSTDSDVDTNIIWSSITSSADGTKLAAVVRNGLIYTSDDSGDTWAPSTDSDVDTNRYWQSITSSSDGTKLAAVVSNGRIYTSDDSGDTWTPSTDSDVDTNRQWRSITSSADGTKLAAVVYNGLIYTSDDSGDTWAPSTDSDVDTNRNWYSITSSSDGTKLAAVVRNGLIYTSDDSGDTWAPSTDSDVETNRNWQSITSSSDGTKLAAVVYNGLIYTSDDSGATWAPSTDSDVETDRNWWSITSSADGTKLAAVVYNGLIYTLNTDRDTISYTVSGPASGGNYSSWNPSVDWGLAENCYASYDNFATTTVTLDCELNGSDIPLPPSGGENTIHLMATHPDFISQIQSVTFTYDTTTSPIILSIDIIIPNDQSSISEFNPMVSWSSSETCSYSYDGSTYTTVDCANSGSDISTPSSTGTSTLYVKGVDSNSVEDIASSTFSLTGFYFCGTSDNDWNNDLNWYSDAGCSATTTAPVSQYSVAVAVGTTSPVVSSSTDPIPNNINTTRLTGSAEQAGVIFSDNVSYSGMLVGNATFNDSSYNTGTVTGDAILNTDHYGSTQTGGVFTVGTGKTYSGEIQGTVYDSESNTITNYVFEGSSQNEGIVNIDATFNNTSEFQVGTVNATATLNGENQIIKGVNSVINFFKQLTDGATSLFFKPNTIFNVSGLFTLLGDDSNNLLTVRSTTPGSSYNLGINGTSNFNFLKLKDAVNTSSLLDLSSKTVQDDGGNSGFTFPANSQTGSRSFSSTNNSTPSIPVSRGGTDSSAVATSGDGTGTSSSNSGIVGIRNSIQQLSPIQFTPTQQFTPFGGLGEDFVPQNSGGTTIPDPFANFQAPSQLDFIQLPSNFSLIISNFLFAQIPQSIQDTLNSIPKIANLVASISGANGSSQSAQIAKLQTNPVAIENIDGDIGVFVIENEEGNNIRTHLTYYDGQLAQLVKINIDKDIKVKLNPLAEGQIFAEYLGVNIPFLNNNEGIPQIELKTPSSRGEYLFSTKATLLPLVIEVIEPQIIEVKTQRRGFIPWLIELIFDR